MADDAQAQTMRELSHLIKPGVDIRIERSRPTWAAGWLEDYPIDATGDALADLYEHLRDEHGGQLYKLTVMSPGEHPVYVGAVPIAGPVREQGRIITRETWDPPGRRERAPNPQPQPAAAAAAPFPMGDILGAVGSFLQLFMNQQKESAQAQIEAVRDMVANSQKQTADFTSALLQVRSEDASQRGLAGQISELMDGVNAVEAMRKRFGAAAAPAADDDDDMLKGALKDATSHFLGAVMGSMAQRRNGARARAQPPRPRRVVNAPPGSVRPLPQPNQVVGEQLQGIPDAIPGHAAAQN